MPLVRVCSGELCQPSGFVPLGNPLHQAGGPLQTVVPPVVKTDTIALESSDTTSTDGYDEFNLACPDRVPGCDGSCCALQSEEPAWLADAARRVGLSASATEGEFASSVSGDDSEISTRSCSSSPDSTGSSSRVSSDASSGAECLSSRWLAIEAHVDWLGYFDEHARLIQSRWVAHRLLCQKVVDLHATALQQAFAELSLWRVGRQRAAASAMFLQRIARGALARAAASRFASCGVRGLATGSAVSEGGPSLPLSGRHSAAAVAAAATLIQAIVRGRRERRYCECEVAVHGPQGGLCRRRAAYRENGRRYCNSCGPDICGCGCSGCDEGGWSDESSSESVDAHCRQRVISPAISAHTISIFSEANVGVLPPGVVDLSFDRLASIAWQSPVLGLLDPASDATICTSPDFFLYLQEADSAGIDTGSLDAGAGLAYLGMGPVAALMGEGVDQVLVIFDKGYLVSPQQARHPFLLSCGRSKDRQSIIFDAVAPSTVLRVPVQSGAVVHLPTRGAFFSRYVPVRAAAKGMWARLAPAPQVSALSLPSYKLAHLRGVHAAPEAIAGAFGVTAHRAHKCPVCLLFKQRSPSPGPAEPAAELGVLLHIDCWEWKKDCVPARGTNYTGIMAALDDHQPLTEQWGIPTPNGKIAARFVKHCILHWATQFGAKVKAIRFDGATYFECEEVDLVLAEFHVRREGSAAYAHYRLKVEHVWDTARRDGATALATCRGAKDLFVHAVLFGMAVRMLIMLVDGAGVSRYEYGTKRKPPMHLVRIFGAQMYGFLFPEQRQQLRLDKADPTSIEGVYVGFDTVNYSFLNVTIGKVWAHAAGAIDEQLVLRTMPGADDLEMRSAIDLAWGPDRVYSAADGAELGTATHGAAAAAGSKEAAAVQPSPELPLALTRKRRVSIADPPSRSAGQPAQAPAAAEDASRCFAKVLVPSQLFPSEECSEFGGRGWLAEVTAMSKDRSRCRLRYCNVYNARGDRVSQWLSPSVVELVDARGEPTGVDLLGDRSLASPSVTAITCAQDDSWSISPLAISALAALAGESLGDCDAERSASFIIAESRVAALPVSSPQLAAVSGRKVKSKLLMPKGVPTWVEVPSSAPQGQKLASAQYWRSAEETFLDNTAAYPGFMLVPADAPELAGVQMARLLWEHKAKLDNDEIVFKARLCWDETSLYGSPSAEGTFADCAVPQAWKVMLHLGASVGATMVRRDVPNAHQSTRIPEEADIPRYSHCPPCHPLTIAGRPAKMKWLNFLNGMPHAARSFSKQLDLHLFSFRAEGRRFVASVIYARVFILVLPSGEFMWLATIVDDLLVVSRSRDDWLLRDFDAHMESKWPGMARRELDGFLNYSLTRCLLQSTVALSVADRIEALVREHFPLVPDRTTFPSTPFHARILELKLDADDAASRDLKKMIISVGMKVLYMAVNVRHDILFAVNRIMRVSSNPPAIAWDCLHHLAAYLYGAREVDLVLGGVDDARDASATLLFEGETPSSFRAGSSCDSGHAEDGPSTGGFTLEVGERVVHATCGKHQATTLGASDGELYESSRAVASLSAHRGFVGELGFAQTARSELKCDSAAVVAIASNQASFKRSLYLARRARFVQEHCGSAGTLRIVKVDGEENVADILTKVLLRKVFLRHRHNLMNLRGKPSVSAVTRALRAAPYRFRFK